MEPTSKLLVNSSINKKLLLGVQSPLFIAGQDIGDRFENYICVDLNGGLTCHGSFPNDESSRSAPPAFSCPVLEISCLFAIHTFVTHQLYIDYTLTIHWSYTWPLFLLQSSPLVLQMTSFYFTLTIHWIYIHFSYIFYHANLPPYLLLSCPILLHMLSFYQTKAKHLGKCSKTSNDEHPKDSL